MTFDISTGVYMRAHRCRKDKKSKDYILRLRVHYVIRTDYRCVRAYVYVYMRHIYIHRLM